jgi:hypothetical protein
VVDVDALADLHERAEWLHAHGNLCPGVAEGHFTPDKKRSYAVTLFRRHGDRFEQQVLLFPKSRKKPARVLVWPSVVDTISVIWRLPPDRFETADEKEFKVRYDSVLYEVLDAATTLIYYSGTGFKTAILTD